MAKARIIKCVVWDLDNTIWDGVLLEGARLALREGVEAVLAELDRRGILHSISSRNDRERATKALDGFGISRYFVIPQIGWNAKSVSIGQIASGLNIALDAIAFVDDDAFELHEVGDRYPEVMCLEAAQLPELLEMPEMMPRFVTADSASRRTMYQVDFKRREAEAEFEGPSEAFLASLNMVLTLAKAGAQDLTRVEELTVRTNQLNSTGYTYSYSELEALGKSPDHLLIIAELEDRFGSYGKIGLALIEILPAQWAIKLLLVSCRVMSRGVGSVLINEIRGLALRRGVRLYAEFVPTSVNRGMYITFKFCGFRERQAHEGVTILEADVSKIVPPPPYVRLRWADEPG